jgi:predicted component of viral defense system (DUF524 family)
MLQQAQRQANFLQEVSLPAHLPMHLSMVLLKHPPYRAALEGYLELHRSAAVQLEEPALEAPLENLPYLYQLWGTLEVICVLLEVAQEFGYCARQYRLIRRDGSGVYVRILPDGQPAFILVHPVRNTVIRLIPQRTYGKRSDMLHSISYEQRPDVAVEVCEPNQPVRIYLFDPKYKLDSETPEESFISSKPLKVDIDKMHAYRDAIRDEEDRRVVQYAAILYPGPPRLVCAWHCGSVSRSNTRATPRRRTTRSVHCGPSGASGCGVVAQDPIESLVAHWPTCRTTGPAPVCFRSDQGAL